MSVQRVPSAVVEAVRDLQGHGKGWTIVAVALGWFLVVGTMLTLPALLPRIIAEFDVSNARAGFAVTLLWLVYGALQFPAGLLTDRLGERRMLLASMVAGAIALSVLTVTPTFSVLMAACGLLGLAGALFATPRVTLLTRLYTDRSGTAIGAVMALGNLGASLLPIGAGFLAAVVGWRLGFSLAIPLFLGVLIAVWLVIPNDSPVADAGPDRSLQETINPLLTELRTREVILVTTGLTLTFFTFQGLTAFLTTYLVTVKGIDDGTAALLYGTLFAVAAVAQPVAGRVADEVGERVVLVAVNGVYAVLLIALVMSSTVLVLSSMAVLLGTQRGTTPVATAYLTRALSEEMRGTGYGLLRTVFTGVSSGAALVVGLLADEGMFDWAFLMLAGVAVIATGCYLLLPCGEE